MPGHHDLYEHTVRTLRSVSAEHAETAAAMCAEPGILGEEPSPDVEELGDALRALEDKALWALCRLARESDDDAAYRAVQESAAWVRAVILNRAVETAGRREFTAHDLRAERKLMGASPD